MIWVIDFTSFSLQVEARLAKFQYLCLLDVIEENSVLEEELRSLRLQINAKGEDIKGKTQAMGTMKTEIQKFQINLVQLQVGSRCFPCSNEGTLASGAATAIKETRASDVPLFTAMLLVGLVYMTQLYSCGCKGEREDFHAQIKQCNTMISYLQAEISALKNERDKMKAQISVRSYFSCSQIHCTPYLRSDHL